MQFRIARDHHKIRPAGLFILLCVKLVSISQVSSLPTQNGDSDNTAADQSIWQTWTNDWDKAALPLSWSPGEGGDPPKESSVLKDVSSNLWNFAEKGLNELKNQSLNILPENPLGNIVSGSRVINEAVNNFVQIGFPTGQNTTFTEGVSNFVNEIQATKKELENWPIKDTIVQGIKDTAGKIFLSDLQATDTHDDRVNNANFQESDDGVDDGQVDKNFRVVRGSSTWIIVLIVIVFVVSVTLALVLTFYVKIRARRRMTKLKDANGAIDFQPEAGTQDPLSIQRQGKHLLTNENFSEP